MKLLRWRLWILMGLILVVALGIKAVQVIQQRRDLFQYRFPGQDYGRLPLRTPQWEAAMVAALEDADPSVHRYARWGLDRFQSTAPALVPILIEQLQTETFESWHSQRWNFARVDPAQALKRFQFPAAVITPWLRRAMASRDDFVRLQALYVLADAANRAGNPSDPTLVACLLKALGDASPPNRLEAARGLVPLDSGTRGRAVTILLGQLRDLDRPLALLAVVNLARFDPEGSAAASVLAARLSTADLRNCVLDLYFLGRLGPLALPAVPALAEAMLRSIGDNPLLPFPNGSFIHDSYLWGNTEILPGDYRGFQPAGSPATLGARVLKQIGPAADQQATAILIGRLGDQNETRRIAAADALGELGQRAVAAFPTLLALAEARPIGLRRDALPYPRDHYIRALWHVTPGDDPRFVVALIRFLESSDSTQQDDALYVLNQINPPAPAAIPALIGILQHGQWGSSRGQAARPLGRYTGPEGQAAVAPLVAALRDPDDFVRREAAKALTHLHAAAPTSPPTWPLPRLPLKPIEPAAMAPVP